MAHAALIVPQARGRKRQRGGGDHVGSTASERERETEGEGGGEAVLAVTQDVTVDAACLATDAARPPSGQSVQGYLTYKKTLPPRTLQ